MWFIAVQCYACKQALLQRDRLVLCRDCLRNRNYRHNVLLLQDRQQAETVEDVPDVHAAARHPGYARQRGPSAGLPADDGRGLDHVHIDHHCSAVRGR